MNLFDHEHGKRRMSRRVLRGWCAADFAAAREGQGLSVQDLARMADIGQSTIHAWEAGRYTPQVDLLAKVMKILQTPIDRVVKVPVEDRYPGDWRVVKGMTQPELAARAGIATTSLRGIERADIGLTDANAAALAKLLDIPAEQYRAAYQRARQRPPGTSV